MSFRRRRQLLHRPVVLAYGERAVKALGGHLAAVVRVHGDILAVAIALPFADVPQAFSQILSIHVGHIITSAINSLTLPRARRAVQTVWNLPRPRSYQLTVLAASGIIPPTL